MVAEVELSDNEEWLPDSELDCDTLHTDDCELTLDLVTLTEDDDLVTLSLDELLVIDIDSELDDLVTLSLDELLVSETESELDDFVTLSLAELLVFETDELDRLRTEDCELLTDDRLLTEDCELPDDFVTL